MNFAIGNQEGIFFVLRWIHFLAGITWIGILYYFNFVQGAFFAEVDAGVKNVAIQKLVPKALWWFRWAAMVTFLSGLSLIMATLHSGVSLQSSWAVMILIGGTLGTIMWFNVWFVIWPAQKVVIASANQVMGGGQAILEAAAKGARALVTSRTNVLFSFPMLFFMGAARHLILNRDFSQVQYWAVALAFGAIIFLLELNALKGKTGPLTTVKGVIHSGIILTIVMYLLIEVTTL